MLDRTHQDSVGPEISLQLPTPSPIPNVQPDPVQGLGARSVSHGALHIDESNNAVASYHGRTSALFDENLQHLPSPNTLARKSDLLVEQGLVAHALRQRRENHSLSHVGNC